MDDLMELKEENARLSRIVDSLMNNKQHRSPPTAGVMYRAITELEDGRLLNQGTYKLLSTAAYHASRPCRSGVRGWVERAAFLWEKVVDHEFTLEPYVSPWGDEDDEEDDDAEEDVHPVIAAIDRAVTSGEVDRVAAQSIAEDMGLGDPAQREAASGDRLLALADRLGLTID